MYDVIIVGAGPAGLMSGIVLSKSNLKVLIIEKNNTAAKKLMVTGNGRCNFTNLKDNEKFLDEVDYNKKYLYSAINLFGPSDIYNFFSKEIKLKEERDNRIFPLSDKSIDVLEVLMNKLKYDINYNESILDIEVLDNYIKVITSKGEYKTKKIIFGVGGASYPHTGSNGDIINIAKKLNHPIVEFFPAEVGIKLLDKHKIPGISISDVVVKAGKIKKSGFLLFTHLGLSGEAIMKISEFVYLNKNEFIDIDFLPMYDINELKNYILSYREKNISSVLAQLFMKNFGLYLLNLINIDDMKIKQLNLKDIDRLINLIKECRYKVDCVDKLALAYVTGGGISLKQVNTKSFESKIHSGVYFVGECLDIHGPIGGYNITLALSTGYSAGVDIINKIK